MARTLWISSSVLVFVALILSLLVSLSLPFIPGLDITRIDTKGTAGQTTDLRMGIWTACLFSDTGSQFCIPKGVGYNVGVFNFVDPAESEIITGAWTRGLVLHPVATSFILVASLATLTVRSTINLISIFATCFAALMALIAFIIDIALFAHVNALVKDADVGGVANTVPGFWLSFVSLVLLIIACFLLCIGRRRENKSSKSASYPLQSPNGRSWADKYTNA